MAKIYDESGGNYKRYVCNEIVGLPSLMQPDLFSRGPCMVHRKKDLAVRARLDLPCSYLQLINCCYHINT